MALPTASANAARRKGCARAAALHALQSNLQPQLSACARGQWLTPMRRSFLASTTPLQCVFPTRPSSPPPPVSPTHASRHLAATAVAASHRAVTSATNVHRAAQLHRPQRHTVPCGRIGRVTASCIGAKRGAPPTQAETPGNSPLSSTHAFHAATSASRDVSDMGSTLTACVSSGSSAMWFATLASICAA
eukprot:364705-Chlamydomonas_euryale.AAC.18